MRVLYAALSHHAVSAARTLSDLSCVLREVLHRDIPGQSYHFRALAPRHFPLPQSRVADGTTRVGYARSYTTCGEEDLSPPYRPAFCITFLVRGY
jgi:hypothetical protein